ncbi:MAG: hypothetical protein H8M99_07165 [Gloeobacteraceae cyanobacterium ES-bin-144]|nr:hypothetical protein [Verrucomicrobiales bacterium]
MFKKPLLILTALLLSCAATLHAQGENDKDNSKTGNEEKTGDTQVPNRFWQASVGGGHYMVALERISAISRHKYLLDGSVIVDEVTIDALGQALARFYFLSPVTDAIKGNAAGNAASRLIDRGRELADNAADEAGTDVHNMVVKKFPETTHARTIEYRVLSAQELTGLYNSVRTAWENGKGRKFTIK